MEFLSAEVEVAEALLPGLISALAAVGISALEKDSRTGIEIFKAHSGPGLLVPTRHGGKGASALQALRCNRVLGSVAPSLAVATTMHNFSVATLVAIDKPVTAFESPIGPVRKSEGYEWMLLDAVANDRLLVSSAFAEGYSDRGILSPTLRAVRDGKDWIVNGSKKPCSLSLSMDLISASAALVENDNESGADPEVGVLILPADVPGVEIRSFWNAPVLSAAESDEVVFKDVRVPDDLVVRPEPDPESGLDDFQIIGAVWFTLLISGAYLGMASALVRQLRASGRGTLQVRAETASELEAAMLGLERIALFLDQDQIDYELQPRAMIARYAAQDSIQRCVSRCVEALGGIQFITDPTIAYLASATQALSFHPPSRRSVAEEMDRFFSGKVASFA